MKKSKWLLLVAAIALATLTLAPSVHAEAPWPNRAITLLVPWPAGGESDTYARALAPELATLLGQSVIVENKPGATGSIGIRHVARGKADGYTLLFANTTSLVGNYVFSPEPVNFDPVKDFTPIAITVDSSYVLWAHPSLGVKNFDEFLARARDASKPPLAFGTTGIGALSEVSVERLARRYRLELTKIPYKGTAPQVQDLIAGHIQIGTANLAVALGAYKDKRLVPLLVIGGKTRLPDLPDIPTDHELGFTDLDLTVWDGVFVHADTPADIVAKLTEAVGAAVKTQGYRKIADGNGHRAIFQSGAAARARIKNDIEGRQKIKTGIK
jgi:tripartite-type tricarboxylate transporter receptor subunit TctC